MNECIIKRRRLCIWHDIGSCDHCYTTHCRYCGQDGTRPLWWWQRWVKPAKRVKRWVSWKVLEWKHRHDEPVF